MNIKDFILFSYSRPNHDFSKNTTLITSPVSHTVYDILQWKATVISNQQSTVHFFQLFAFALWKVFSMFLCIQLDLNTRSCALSCSNNKLGKPDRCSRLGAEVSWTSFLGDSAGEPRLKI